MFADPHIMANQLGQLIQCKTVSNSDESKIDGGEFERLHALLEEFYPLLHQHLEKRTVSRYGLLYKWAGKSSEKSLLFMAHQDVVPADDAGWKQPPFSGELADGCVWGRGAIDIKCMICCEMEAVEFLLSQGFQPAFDIYLAYGYDEEVNSKHSTHDIVQLLQSEGVKLSLVLDEGDSFAEGDSYGAPGKTLACIGVAEKGYLDIELAISSPGGHASRPLPTSALAELARAIDAVEKMDTKCTVVQPVREFYTGLAPHMQKSKLKDLLMDLDANQAAFIREMKQTRRGNAAVSTTHAATMAQGSPAANVLPQKATASINFRLIPGDSVDSIIEQCRKAIANPNIEITTRQAEEASAIAPTTGSAYRLLDSVTKQVYPDVIVLPSLVFGATDSRHYEPICDNIFKFLPIRACVNLGHTVHSENERMPIDGLDKGAEFFAALIRQCEKLED